MSHNILIRHCPHCAQLIHFEGQRPIQICWNCGKFSDLSRVLSTHEVVLRAMRAGIDRILPTLPGEGLELTPSVRRSKFVLALGIPALVCMLFLCNSLNVHPVSNWLDSFFGSHTGTGACRPIDEFDF